MLTRIHVNGQNLRQNRIRDDNGRYNAVFTAKDYKRNRKGTQVVIHGPSKLVYRPRNPLKSHAVAWIETEAPVDVSFPEQRRRKR